MSIHEHLPPQVRRELKQVGWTKGWSWPSWHATRVNTSESATWLHKAIQKARFAALDVMYLALQPELLVGQGSGMSRTSNCPTPVTSINLFSKKSGSAEFFTCSMTGWMRPHCSVRLRPLSRRTIKPGCTSTLRSSTKSCAFVVTTAKSGQAHSSISHGRLDRLSRRGARIEHTRRRRPIFLLMPARYSHPATNGSLGGPMWPPNCQPLSRASWLFTKTSEQASICQIASTKIGKVFCDLLFGHALPKQRCNMMQGNAGSSKKGLSSQNLG